MRHVHVSNLFRAVAIQAEKSGTMKQGSVEVAPGDCSCCIYRHPDQNVSQFKCKLVTELHKLSAQSSPCIVLLLVTLIQICLNLNS